jgi:ketosteroid isomerase-like protein
MTAIRILLVTIACLVAVPASPAAQGTAEDVRAILRRQSEELLDAVTAGDAKVWDRYLADDVLFTDESGATMTKAQLVEGIRPLPKGISGELNVQDFDARIHGGTAVTTYVADESETYFGQVIHARYRITDTWIRTGDQWRLVASQVQALRQDPPALSLAAARLDEYVGVYVLTPEISYTIKREGDSLVGQRSGRQPEKLAAEVADFFFVAGQPRLRKVFQRGADGGITGFVERRESWDVLWKRANPSGPTRRLSGPTRRPSGPTR